GGTARAVDEGRLGVAARTRTPLADRRARPGCAGLARRALGPGREAAARVRQGADSARRVGSMPALRLRLIAVRRPPYRGLPMTNRPWKVRGPASRDQVDALARELGLASTTASVLVRRGYSDPERAREFLGAELPEHD